MCPPRSLLSILALLAVACTAAPIAEDEGETDQVEENNYALSASKDAWTTNLVSPVVDTIVENGWEIDPEGPAGCAVGLVKDGETIYLHGYGMASETEPWSYQTVAPVGSIAKTFTALSLRKLDQEMGASLDVDDTFGQFIETTPLDDVTLLTLLHHASGAPHDPTWDPGSIPEWACGACTHEKWLMTHPRTSFLQMDDSIVLPADPTYSNVGYTALAAVIDELTYDNGSLWPWQRGYEAYTWHRVGRFKNSDVYTGQMLTLALSHSWRFANDDIPHYARGYTYVNHTPSDTWDSPDFEGWEGPSGGWVMSIGDLSRLIEGFAKFDILDETTMRDMATGEVELPQILGAGLYGQGVIEEHAPTGIGEGGLGHADGDEPPQPGDHLWWHGGDIAGHVAVWTWWPDLQEEHGKDPFGVALICNKRNTSHSAQEALLPVAREIHDAYLETGIGVFNVLPAPAAPSLGEVAGRTYELHLDTARIGFPRSFFVPLDQLDEGIWVTVDQVGNGYVSMNLVLGDAPDDPNAQVTPLGTFPYTPGEPIASGIGAGATITIDGMATLDLDDVRLRTGFARDGTELADATLTANLDLRQLDAQHDLGWSGICADLESETTCAPCADGKRACIDVTIDYLRGVSGPTGR